MNSMPNNTASAPSAQAVDELQAFLTRYIYLFGSGNDALSTAVAMKARVAELEAALKPFADAARRMETEWSVWEDHESHWSGGYAGLTVGDLRAARVAIKYGSGD